jgi:outer membrane protein assembly factor BamB
MKTLAHKVMDLAEQQGLLEGKAIAELRKQVAESKFVITPEAIAKVLVDHGHLTPFQARKLVSQAQGNEPDPIEQKVVEQKPAAKPKPRAVEDLTFADPADRPLPRAPEPVDELFEVEETKPQKKPAEQSPKKPISKPAAPDTGAPAVGAPKRREEKPPPALVQPVEGSTAEDFVDLEPVKKPAGPRGNRWKTDEAAMSETIELTPIDLGAPMPVTPPADLVPIDDLFGPEPAPAPKSRGAFSGGPAPPNGLTPIDGLTPVGLAPVDGLTPLSPLAPLPARRAADKNVWDSPLMLIGGGALGVLLVVFGLLFYALTRGSAAEMFTKAEEEYRAGSYSNAIGIYEKFLKQYPEDPNAGLARVRRGMATLRQVSDDGRNPRLALDTAKQVLPEIEKEEKFSDARGELAAILPDIADSFATQATQTADATKKSDLVQKAGDALTLVNNPAYLPASLRKDRESHILRVVDKLRSAERGIQQEKDLATTVEKIGAAAEKGDAAAAYQLQADLVRTYPALTANAQLVSAVRKIGEKERQLVTTSSGGPEPMTTDVAGGSEPVVISYREPPAPKAAAAQPVFVLIDGSVYGVDASSGRVLWRRFVGYETTNQPLALSKDANADVVVVDGHRHELLRLKGSSGELVWRQKLNAGASGPVLTGDHVMVATPRGQVLSLAAASGKIAASSQLPQGTASAPAVRQSQVYQLGEHSTLFVLDAQSLACSETVYLGHRAGEILVPPVAVLDQVLVVRSPADDYSEIQVVGPDVKTKRLTTIGKPQRLKGRVTTPLAVSGARVVAVTDRGQIVVYDVDPAGASEHLRLVASVDATESSPREVYCALDRNRVWVANHRREMFEVQSSLSQLARRWSENHDDTFLGPLQLTGDTLVQIRRREGVAGVLVEGCRAVAGGEAVWTTHVAQPVLALVASELRGAVDALTAEGRLYSLNEQQVAAGQSDEPKFSPPSKQGVGLFDEAPLSTDGQTLVWTESSGKTASVYDVRSGEKPTAVSLPAAAAAPAAALGADVIAPLSNGAVALVSPDAAAPKAAPFMPPLSPDSLPLWTSPAALSDGKTCIISDGRGAVYALTKREGAKHQLAAAGQSKASDPVVSHFAAIGSVAVGVMRQQNSDALAGIDAKGAAAFEAVPLEGRVHAGPFAAGRHVFVWGEPDGLVCLGPDGKIRWRQPPERGVLAGSPVALADGDLLIAYQSGLVCRVDAASGNRLAEQDAGEPLAGPMCVLGSKAFIAGGDGVVHRVSVPPRP